MSKVKTDCCDHCHIDFEENNSVSRTSLKFIDHKKYLPAYISTLLLLSGIVFEHYESLFFTQYVAFVWFVVAYLFVGIDVVLKAFKNIFKGAVFNEFFLMSIATFGAFAIGEYAEGVAVMLFYTVGEHFQDSAVEKAKSSIKGLLKIQSEEVVVIENNKTTVVHPKEVKIGQTIQIKPGEKVALDGVLLSEKSSFDTAVLTGESVPKNIYKGEEVYAGMINLNTLTFIEVTKTFKDTKLSKILALVQKAATRKAKTQRFITRFAKIYTPIVVFLAVAIVIIPSLILDNYIFNDWLYRALIFLVISCPCALVISIPLGYFGGIGAGSANGILFKGSNFIDMIAKVDTVILDKTGTLTEGVFEVKEVISESLSKEQLLSYAASLEQFSTHPIAKAVVAYTENIELFHKVKKVEEITGHGLKAIINNKEVLAGNGKLLNKFGISYPKKIEKIIDTVVLIAVENNYAGYITIADRVKKDAKQTVELLKNEGIDEIMMLSGDKQSVVTEIADKLNIKSAIGNLLPEDKYNKVAVLKEKEKKIAFVGDGVNDAPVLKLSDIGIAMGGLGSDAAIETADIVIQTDQPSKIYTAIKIGKATKKIVWQNIFLAFGVKLLVLILGAGGLATMWEAVFADVGVALLAIVNATRIQHKKF